jgi:hypothetical protein
MTVRDDPAYRAAMLEPHEVPLLELSPMQRFTREVSEFYRRKRVMDSFNAIIGINDATIGEILALPRVTPSLRKKLRREFNRRRAGAV